MNEENIENTNTPPQGEILESGLEKESLPEDQGPKKEEVKHKKVAKAFRPRRVYRGKELKDRKKLFDPKEPDTPERRRVWQEAIIEYLANPFDNTPVQKFCQQTGIPQSSYYDYLSKNRELVFSEAAKRRKQYYSEMRVKAYKALVSRMNRSDKILQMVMEMMGDYIPKSEQKVEYTSPEEKKARIKALLDKVTKQTPPTQDSAG